MKKIVIIGAGDGGRLVAKLVKEQNMFKICGFIDDKENLQGKIINGCPVIATSKDFNNFKNMGFVVAIGPNMRNREVLLNRAVKAGLKPVNVVDNRVIVDKTVKIGKGVVILTECIICSYARVGDNNFIFTGTLIEHDSVIGNNVFFGPRVALAGRVQVGSNSFLGINSCVIEGVRVGSNVIVGAGAVVIKDVVDNIVVAGNPAKKIRDND